MKFLSKIITNSFLLLFPLSLLGQKDSLVTIIINDYCEMAQQIELEFNQDSLPDDELDNFFRREIGKVREKSIPAFSELRMIIIEEHPEFSEQESLLETTILMMEPLIQNCDSYSNIMKFLLPPCKGFKESPSIIANKVSTIIDDEKPIRLLDQFDVFNKIWTDVIFENEEIVEAEYEDGIANFDFMEDVRVCLCHKNERYYKAYLLFLSLRPVDRE